ncbi:hypothetical protein LCGC14_1804590 [marine sediment metagenome]|uniref:DUF3943 domain-containing protein n=1 Tax=marine sediment metagenome TaxID=412755 RepID=A0A0F9J3D2_9ZZZZ
MKYFLLILLLSSNAFAATGLEGIKWGLTHPPVWDPNPWYINYVGHPYVGSETYLLARNRNCSKFKSFLISTGASVTWEYTLEPLYGARPSIQDLLVTSTIGSLFGELRYWLKNKTNNKVLKIILDPIDALFGGINE